MAFEKLQAADDKGMFKVPARGLASTGQTVLSSDKSKWGMTTAPTIAGTAFTHPVSDAGRRPEGFSASEPLLSGPVVNESKQSHLPLWLLG